MTVPDPGLEAGDEARPDTASAAEDVCPACGGSGTREGERCDTCGGSGRVIEAVGGGLTRERCPPLPQERRAPRGALSAP
jgi:RecJ-like exonuclease